LQFFIAEFAEATTEDYYGYWDGGAIVGPLPVKWRLSNVANRGPPRRAVVGYP
jgi:hypothetical protein